MISLPEQMSAEALRTLVEEYGNRLSRLPKVTALYEGLPLHGVRGGHLITRVGGMAEIAPNMELAGESRSPVPVVELIYQWPEYGYRASYSLETSLSRLIKVGSAWQPASMSAPGRSRHVITLDEVARRLVVRLEILTPRCIVGPLTESTDTTAQALTEFVVPPAATAILGTGTLRYLAGPELSLDGSAPVLLLRLTEQFNYELAEGAIYARFVGTQPALVRIGDAWLRTPPAVL